MYNSLTIKLLVGLWSFLEDIYSKSLTKKFFDAIKKLIKELFKGSIFKLVLKKDMRIIENTFLYGIYMSLLNFMEKLTKKTNLKFNTYKKTSRFGQIVSDIFKDYYSFITSVVFIFLPISIGVLLNLKVLGIYVNSLYNIIPLALALLFIILTRARKEFRLAIRESFVLNWIKSIFDLDKGGENWW